MKKIICTIINNSGSIQTGDMIEDNNITEEFFINWVYRNCTGCNMIIIEFKDRLEIYFLEENYDE